MEWLLIPSVILAIGLLFGGLAFWWDYTNHSSSWFIAVVLILGCALFIAMLICPTSYYASRTQALQAEAYYEQIVLPHMVEENEDYVVISGLEPGVWQAGSLSLPGYNSYIKTTSYWDNIPIIGSVVYPVPSHLKYVQVK